MNYSIAFLDFSNSTEREKKIQKKNKNARRALIGVVYLPHLFSWNKIRTVAAAATIIEDFFCPKTKKEFFSAECAKKKTFSRFLEYF